MTGLDATIARALAGYNADLSEDDAHAVIAALQAELDRRDAAQTGGEWRHDHPGCPGMTLTVGVEALGGAA